VLAQIAAVAALATTAAAPPPNAPLPSGAAPTAQRLAATTRSLDAAVAAWRASGTLRPPRELRLWALHQQRVYSHSGSHGHRSATRSSAGSLETCRRMRATFSKRDGRSSG
jgi:hypothetical protein